MATKPARPLARDPNAYVKRSTRFAKALRQALRAELTPEDFRGIARILDLHLTTDSERWHSMLLEMADMLQVADEPVWISYPKPRKKQ